MISSHGRLSAQAVRRRLWRECSHSHFSAAVRDYHRPRRLGSSASGFMIGGVGMSHHAHSLDRTMPAAVLNLLTIRMVKRLLAYDEDPDQPRAELQRSP